MQWGGRTLATLAGRSVELRVDGKVLASATVRADGQFSGLAPRVPGPDVRTWPWSGASARRR